jgi:hypothetical protein
MILPLKCYLRKKEIENKHKMIEQIYQTTAQLIYEYEIKPLEKHISYS